MQAKTQFSGQLLSAARQVVARWEHGDLAAAVRALDKAIKEHALATAEVVEIDGKKRLQCPRCGNTQNFRYIEDIVNHRGVYSEDPIQDGQLRINGHYETGEGYDDGMNGRLECRGSNGFSCFSELAIPEDLELDFR